MGSGGTKSPPPPPPPDKLHREYILPVEARLKVITRSLSSPTSSPDMIDKAFEDVTQTIREAERVIPRSRHRSHIKPFWCPELDTLKANTIKMYREWCNAGRPRNTDDPFRAAHNEAKKRFRNRIKQISKSYEEQKICDASKNAETDRNGFWHMLKKARNGNKVTISALKNKTGKVVHSIDEILEVWRQHFSTLCTPRALPHYDKEHYDVVCKAVTRWHGMRDNDEFLKDDFTEREIRQAINKLNGGKAPGHDDITKEHIKPVENSMAKFLETALSRMVATEYIPTNFRRGIQIPLYKGKNTSTLDPNNFRGITLLSTFNKIFEILLWARIEKWWHDSGAVSESKGACCKGVSSLHTALLLQETIATNLEEGKRVFVTFLDVSKAFDRVFIEGLFYQLRNIGIVGKTWRMLYSCYKGFLYKVRIHNKFSQWYEMTCGIHQGGYLSLLKYVAFINTLLVELRESNLCCNLYRIPSSPLGYADDIAAATTAKNKTEQVLDTVFKHSCKWRYDLNAKKSSIVVYGETLQENKNNRKYRLYTLGHERVLEKISYDHVGVKSCNGNNYIERTDEKISKARKALSAASALGIKKGGLSIMACNVIYWCLIIPILTYGAELWILKQSDIDALDKFQRYAGRRVQRFPTHTPNETSFRGLGWMRIENYINAKKLIFIRTMLIRDNDCIFKRMFKLRAISFNSNIASGIANAKDSPIYDMLRVSIVYNVYDTVMNMVLNEHTYSKLQSRRLIWERAWEIEDEDWIYCSMFYKCMEKINLTIGSSMYMNWWHISDIYPHLMKPCETMAKLVCGASELRSDDYRLKHATYNMKACTLCNLAAYECSEHMIMSCAHNDDLRISMINEIENSNDCLYIWADMSPQHTYKVLLGSKADNTNYEDMIPIWCIAAIWIQRMYKRTINDRAGIG